MDFRSCKQRFSKVKKLKAHFWWVPMVVHLLIFFFFWGFWGCFWFFVVLCCSYELGDSKEKAAATTCFVKPLPVEKEKRKKHTHTCTHRVGVVIDHRLNCLLSWMCCCCCSSTIVECLPCSTCYIYVCNASQNLSIFRSHRDFPSFLREKNFAVQFLSNLQQQQQQQISNLRPSAAVAASAAGEDF